MLSQQTLSAVANFFSLSPEELPPTELPPHPEFGDAALPLFPLAKKLGKNPAELAASAVAALKDSLPAGVEEVSAAGGFLNFRLAAEELLKPARAALAEKGNFGAGAALKGRKVMVEFAHPNTHKAFHIGHLRPLSLGETLVRILEKAGAEVFRANYQGDVGPHVAKCLFGVRQNLEELARLRKEGTTAERAEFLGKCYAAGATAAKEADSPAAAEVKKLNGEIYAASAVANQAVGANDRLPLRDPVNSEIYELWQETRQWSLDYFDGIYQRFDSRFDRLFFESECWQRGLELAAELEKKGILVESDGALIFQPTEEEEKAGLHTRVFKTAAGTATYEGKELALAELEPVEFPCEKIIHTVSDEQAGYFRVLIRVLEKAGLAAPGAQEHVSLGAIGLTSGKMSSRTGDVITAESLLETLRAEVEKKLAERDLPAAKKEEIAEAVAIAAAKFELLKIAVPRKIAFDPSAAVSFEGATGPYLQYAVARISSLLRKAGAAPAFPDLKDLKLASEERELTKKLALFAGVLEKAALSRDPSGLANFLLELAQLFSSFYAACPILSAEEEKEFRLALAAATREVLKEGLRLLAIPVLEEM
jgi:arginyl-tRNA synthetase